MKLMLLTNDVDMARTAQDLGVERIFVDLEYINKVERQMGRNTFISTSKVEDVLRIRKVIDKSELLVRVNPINPNSQDEINKVIEYGADIVMLPMVLDAEDVRQFVKMVDGRAKVIPLLEMSQTIVRLDEILDVNGIDEIFIGLNDMHISMGLSFMFELLSGGIIEYMATKIKAKNIPFGFGGLAKIGEGDLPAEYILGEHYRLGSESVILSRTFRNEVGDSKGMVDLEAEINKIRKRELKIKSWTEEEFEKNKLYVNQCVKNIVNS